MTNPTKGWKPRNDRQETPPKKLQQYGMRPLFMCSEDGKTMFFWPYCSTCQKPFSFDDEEPFAYCDCGTSEWSYPRPAEWIPEPERRSSDRPSATEALYNLL